MQELLNAMLEAEKEAAQIIEQSEEAALASIDQAKREAQKKLLESRKTAIENSEKLIASKKEDAQEQRKKSVQAALIEIDKETEKARTLSEQGTTLFVDSLLKSM